MAEPPIDPLTVRERVAGGRVRGNVSNPPWLKPVEDGCELLILVQPRASRSKILGEHDGRLKIALAAPPVDGEANAALIELLSDLFEIKRTQLTLLDGHTGRRKRLKITGLDAARVSMVISTGR